MAKRIFDLLAATFTLVIFAPVMGIVAIAVFITMGSPILFRQVRPGYCGSPFTIYKFRTMNTLYDSQGQLLKDAKRLTPFGKFIRATSLDELPQLWNVLKGEMSLVGPRPLLMEYLDYYSDEQMRRHEVRPGITGWAQIHGRNALCWEEKFALDVWYVEHVGVWLDLKIILATVVRVFQRKGIHASGHATMRPFSGVEK